jgi:antitoxin component of MazEF toxin-antitoxin module
MPFYILILSIVDMKLKAKKRKVQQTGYSFWITLPPIWTESMGLLKGDLVKLEINENGVLEIRKDETTDKKRRS